MNATTQSAGYATGLSEKAEKAGALGKYTVSFGLSVALVSLFNAALVILKETNEHTVLAWMKAATSHHWITHGLIDVVLFVILGFALAQVVGRMRARPGMLLASVAGGVILGALAIAAFYLFV